MNIIIEDAVSLKYLTSEGRWTKIADEGKSFAGTKLAFKAAKLEPVGKFNIVGYILRTKQFINLDHGHEKVAVAIPSGKPDSVPA